MAGALYVVATPIGNLSDVSPRAKSVLEEVELVVAEDTRTAKILLGHLKLNKKIVSCHKFNEKARLDQILSGLLAGQNAALISDAGTPCISDPGHLLINAAVSAGIRAVPVGGPCAVTSALSVSGFDLRSFAFYGFPPRDMSGIKKILETVKKDSQAVAVFYESPMRIVRFIKIIGEVLPDAKLCLCNDLTKKFERIYRGEPRSVLEELTENPDREKGEYTLVLNKGEAEEAAVEEKISAEAMLADIMIRTGCTLKEAVAALVLKKKGQITKNELYTAGLRLKEKLRAVL